jgi:ATP-dependent Lhr-like helicase
VGNPKDLLCWLSAGSNRPGRVINPPETTGPGSPPSAELELDYVGSTENAARVIAAMHQGEKRLVFCDSRSRVEQVGSLLRGQGIKTFVSHSSLSLDERHQAERAFAQGRDCVIVATSALELGIDVGDLDRVIQIDAPATVSSFMQRMGRTGRRSGTKRNCLFLATADEGLLRAAGLVRLWAAAYVEPVQAPPRPLHILAQQLMALALQERGIGRHEWFSWIEAVPAFREMRTDEVDAQVSWMLEKEILWDDAGVVWLGRQGQDSYGRKNFLDLFSVFTSPPEFTVLYGKQELGSVHEVTFIARQDEGPIILLLGGRSWRLTHLDWKRRQAFVEPNDQGGRSRWRGQGQVLSHALCQAIRAIVAGETEEAYWSRRARQHMAEVRQDFPWASNQHTSLVHSPQGEWSWWTFAGGKANAGLAHGLSETLSRRVTWDNFALRIQGELRAEELEVGIRLLRAGNLDAIIAAVDDQAMKGLKFAECLPPSQAAAVVQSRLGDPLGVAQVLQHPVNAVFDS